MRIVIGSGMGFGGETMTIDVVLQTAVDVFETENDITFGPEIQLALDANGEPRCRVNPALDRNGIFTLDCDDAGVCTLYAVVLASGNPDPIPDGSVLYRCDIRIDPDAAAGTYPLVCATATADDADSIACVDGSVQVIGAPPTSNQEDDGCQTTGGTGGRGLWLVALPASLLWLRRRSSR